MNVYLIFILAILIGTYLLDTLVDILNMRHLKTDLPEEFHGYYDADRYKKSQDYLKDKTHFGLVIDSVATPLAIAFILSGGFNFVDQFARGFNLTPIPTGLIFAGTLMLALQILLLPFSIYRTFVIEEKYDFNRTTARTFVLDLLKSWGLAALVGSFLLSAILYLFHMAGALAWFYCWMAVTFFQFILLFVAPVLILPLFNKFTPLEGGDLKRAIHEYAKSQGFKMKGIFTMDGSRRSSKSNAFFTGFGRFRRIVLYDTLIERHTVDELISVLAHEMGHFKMKHTIKSLGLSVITTGLMFFILSFFINNRELFAAFKMHQTSIYASLVFFGFLYSPMEMVLSILGNALSRKYEFQADTHAVQTYDKPLALISALKRLSVDNLSNLTPHPLRVFFSYSHPPVLERIQAIRRSL